MIDDHTADVSRRLSLSLQLLEVRLDDFCSNPTNCPAQSSRMASPHHDPYTAPPLRGLSFVRTTLRVFVALQCWGYAAAHLHFHSQSPLAVVLQKEFFITASETSLFDFCAALSLVMCGVSCLLRPAWPLLLAMTAGQMMFVAAKAWLGEGSHPAIIVANHACIMLSPFLLGCADFWPGHRKFSLGYWIAIAWLMRMAVCVALIGQGIDGIIQSQKADELVRVARGTIEKLTLEEPTQSQARMALAMVSAMQIAIGSSLAINRSRTSAGLAALLGVFVATCYSLGLDMVGYPRTLIHLIDGGMAAALGFYWVGAIQEGQPTYIPEGLASRMPHAKPG